MMVFISSRTAARPERRMGHLNAEHSQTYAVARAAFGTGVRGGGVCSPALASISLRGGVKPRSACWTARGRIVGSRAFFRGQA